VDGDCPSASPPFLRKPAPSRAFHKSRKVEGCSNAQSHRTLNRGDNTKGTVIAEDDCSGRTCGQVPLPTKPSLVSYYTGGACYSKHAPTPKQHHRVLNTESTRSEQQTERGLFEVHKTHTHLQEQNTHQPPAADPPPTRTHPPSLFEQRYIHLVGERTANKTANKTATTLASNVGVPLHQSGQDQVRTRSRSRSRSRSPYKFVAISSLSLSTLAPVISPSFSRPR